MLKGIGEPSGSPISFALWHFSRKSERVIIGTKSALFLEAVAESAAVDVK